MDHPLGDGGSRLSVYVEGLVGAIGLPCCGITLLISGERKSVEPAAPFVHSPDRKGEHPRNPLKEYRVRPGPMTMPVQSRSSIPVGKRPLAQAGRKFFDDVDYSLGEAVEIRCLKLWLADALVEAAQ